jgi:alpha-glucosidase
MALADAPDAQIRIRGVIEAAHQFETPISAFHFGSGYTSIGKKRYVFTWNKTKFPQPGS